MLRYDLLFPHRLMIRDSTRTKAFRDAIAKVVRTGDAVLDVGAGTGILSMFAAHAGARVVYAVEQTQIAALAAELAAKNDLSNTIKVIQADAADAVLPEKVDVLVSEWLGSIGVDENLLWPVLCARDRWLKPGGAIIPWRVSTWLAPACLASSPDANFFQEKPYGLDLSLLAEASIHEQLCSSHRVTAAELMGNPLSLWQHDLRKMTAGEALLPSRGATQFEFSSPAGVNALAAWFVAELADGQRLENSPSQPATHWGQLVLPLDRTLEMNRGDRLEVNLVCLPKVAGQSDLAWSVRRNEGRWEHHDTRVVASGSLPRDPNGAIYEVQQHFRNPPTLAQARSGAAIPSDSNKPASALTRFLARLAADPALFGEFLQNPAALSEKLGLPLADQQALCSRTPQVIEARMMGI